MLPIFVIAEGGLGNQLFQAAYGLSLQHRFNRRLIFISITKSARVARECELDAFGLEVVELPTWLARLASASLRVARKLRFDFLMTSLLFEGRGSGSLPKNGPLIVNGYWQKEVFYRDGLAELKTRTERLPNVLSGKDRESGLDQNCLAVHVRRGDYVSDSRTATLHNVCTSDYFMQAVDAVIRTSNVSKVVVFSDDPTWAKDALSFDAPTIHIDPVASPSWVDMLRMSRCGHFVISNSSYSFWAATLSPHTGARIAPSYWFRSVRTSSLALLGPTWLEIEPTRELHTQLPTVQA